MADPTKPVIDYSYTGFEQANQDGPFPGTQLDNDLAKLSASNGTIIDALGQIRRSDGALVNGIVTPDSLAPGLYGGQVNYSGSVRFDLSMTLTDAQKTQARANIGAAPDTALQASVADLRYLRKLSSGELSLADSSAIRSDGNIADAATNTAEINTLLSHLTSGGSLFFNPGVYASNPLSFITNRHVRLSGAGKQLSCFLWNGAAGSNLFTISQNSQGYRTQVEGFSVVKVGGVTGSVAVSISYVHAASQLYPTVIARDLECISATGSNSAGCILIKDAWNVVAEDINFVGLAEDFSPVGALILTGTCTVVEASRIKATWAQAPVYVFEAPTGQGSEGLRLHMIQGVATNWLVYDNHAHDAPEMHITTSQGETMMGGIYTLNRPQTFFSGIDLYKRVSSTQNWEGFHIESQSPFHSNGVSMHGVQINGFKGSSAGGTATGLVMPNTKGGNLELSVVDCDIGINLFNSSRVKVDLTYDGVTTPASGTTGSIITANQLSRS